MEGVVRLLENELARVNECFTNYDDRARHEFNQMTEQHAITMSNTTIEQRGLQRLLEELEESTACFLYVSVGSEVQRRGRVGNFDRVGVVWRER